MPQDEDKQAVSVAMKAAAEASANITKNFCADMHRIAKALERIEVSNRFNMGLITSKQANDLIKEIE
jgi:hypothetical protein